MYLIHLVWDKKLVFSEKQSWLWFFTFPFSQKETPARLFTLLISRKNILVGIYVLFIIFELMLFVPISHVLQNKIRLFTRRSTI